ncbi:MAG: OsmC family protein [Chloroflexi bacterium]|nr:OsmC family protein [Chloroflexota bacterium]MBI2979718.1 OsmC family protein [Chloroflexota bacterium]
MAVLNNVNVGMLEQVAREAEADKSKLKRTQKIEGEWRFEEGAPQFRAEVGFEGGKVVFESDQPKNLGGGGTRPGPLHYCFFGLVACYTATFAAIASQMGIKLNKLSAKLEGNLNFSRVFGLSIEPVMEEIRIALHVKSDTPREKLEEVEKLASERCPAVFALTESVRLNTVLKVE